MKTPKDQTIVPTDAEIADMIARGELPTAAEFMQGVLADIERLELKNDDQ